MEVFLICRIIRWSISSWIKSSELVIIGYNKAYFEFYIKWFLNHNMIQSWGEEILRISFVILVLFLDKICFCEVILPGNHGLDTKSAVYTRVFS